MPDHGENLIFLISQPRSGSTLLQHILGAHSQVHTAPEPWFMLHLAYALKPEGITAEYDTRSAYRGLVGFLEGLPDGRRAYVEAARKMASDLYAAALTRSGKSIFLDKTPRYYLIIPEILEILPRSRVILLVRNPLAVLASRLKGPQRKLREPARQQDLVVAPRRILEAAHS